MVTRTATRATCVPSPHTYRDSSDLSHDARAQLGALGLGTSAERVIDASGTFVAQHYQKYLAGAQPSRRCTSAAQRTPPL